MQRLAFTLDIAATLRQTLVTGGYNHAAVLTDTNTRRLAWPLVADALPRDVLHITIDTGEEHKTVETLYRVWSELQHARVTRHTVLVCVGGGLVTDLGGLAAATFKRGLPFIHVPTTLLGAVDAAVGRKTGVNFGGLKNEVGVFAEPVEVLISTAFLDTLPHKQLLAGYAEMLKHALLSGADALTPLLHNNLATINHQPMLDLVRESVAIKQRIVECDPHELGPRKALNLGHTVGHAIESLLLDHGTPVPHGIAVAWGLVTELVLSHLMLRFPSAALHEVAAFVRQHYPAPPITCDHYDTLLQLMTHDKKSLAGEINCTLLRQVGDPVVDNAVAPGDMGTALDLFRDLMGV